ncbi:FAS1 domain-containing protein precursor [Trichodelitschia bisporula]|uniref:FAS1 domain-containing protein n=1 Tax=Trichodelitschia bisporula TaxID=703511 RepID=A0A6G1I5Z8_9PEZI|nr:FAS1 domain-containing protein precursor [Trichodelitschia bisporula]
MSASRNNQAGLTIFDTVTRHQNIAIFSELCREVDSVTDSLQDSKQKLTVLAPDNDQLEKLSRKPWESSDDYSTFGADAYGGQEGTKRAHNNLRRFVQFHIIAQSPWEEGKKVQTLAGTTLVYETKSGMKWIQPGNIKVLEIMDEVSNGQVWRIDGILRDPDGH